MQTGPPPALAPCTGPLDAPTHAASLLEPDRRPPQPRRWRLCAVLAPSLHRRTQAISEATMDANRFDALTCSLGQFVSRRATLRLLGGGGLGALLTRLGPGETEAACLPGESCDCTPLSGPCSQDSQCCSRLCGSRGAPDRCACKRKGALCSRDSNCCSRVCRPEQRGGTRRCGCRKAGATCSADIHCCSLI